MRTKWPVKIGYPAIVSQTSIWVYENLRIPLSFWFNKSAVKNFFENVVQVLQKHIFTVNRIYHFDESGISAVYAWSPSWKKSKTSGSTGFRRLFLGALFSQMEIQYRLYLYFQGCITKTTLLMMHYSL